MQGYPAPGDSAVESEAITPSDVEGHKLPLVSKLSMQARALYAGVGGNVTYVKPNGVSVATYIPAGVTLSVRFISVKATGTDATSMLAMY